MSYRKFKQLLGETSLERKCRYLFGACLLALITGSFYWYLRRTEELLDDHSRSTGRILVWSVFFKHHLKLFEQNDYFRPIIDDVWGELAPIHFAGYEYRLVVPKTARAEDSAKLAPQTELERRAIGLFQRDRSQNEVFISSPERRYLGAVRATKSCLVCHRDLRSPPLAQEGDLMAAVSIRFPPSDELEENRLILIAMAMITAVVAMAIFYVIVRYVIAKPVKHLKEVSEQIANGRLDVRAEIQTGDEFEELSHAFNRMLRNLMVVQEQLRSANRELDRKVDELAKANLALHELYRQQSEFLTTMSHELRTPLNSVIGFSEILSDSPHLTEKERRYAQHIHTAGRQLLAIVNDLLDLAKIESGRMEIHPEEFSVPEIVEGMIAMNRPMADRKRVELTSDIAPNLPRAYQDPGKIQQILYNLLSNAVKFTPEGGKVVVTARVEGDELVLAVKDTGVGIPPEDRERIFEKFRQGSYVRRDRDSLLTREYPGTGLGLSIVRELSRLLGGDVFLESTVGVGSTFTVRVPLRYGHPKRDGQPPAPVAVAAERPQTGL
jgi:two-component system sensor histidine kinase BarA